MFGKLCSFAALALTVTAVAQVRLPIRIVTPSDVITAADITYDGMIRIDNVVDTFSASRYGALTGRQVAGDTHLIFQAAFGAVDHPDVVEVDITGLTPSTNVATAPEVVFVANWGDISGGAAGTWKGYDGSGNAIPLNTNANVIPKGLYWHEGNQLLYSGWSVGYTDIEEWTLAATALVDDSPLDIDTYGPWRFTYDAGNGSDGTRSHFFLAHPTTGKFLGTGTSKSGNAAIPWGPSLIGGADWPTTATTSGFAMTPILLPDTYANFHYPTNTYDVDGTPQAEIKQFQYPTALSYAFEIFNPSSLRADPAQNSGRGTWADESDSNTQPIWFEGTHKRGVIFPASLQGSLTQTTTCAANETHAWYRNELNGYIQLSGIVGSFVGSEQVLGLTSAATSDASTFGQGYLFVNAFPSDYSIGETVQGQTSGATGVVVSQQRFDSCPGHDCACITCATGPVTTWATPVFIVYDPDELERAKTDLIDPWEVEVSSVIDIDDTFNDLVLLNRGGQRNSLSAGYLLGNKFYLIASAADNSRNPGNPNDTDALIHVFTIDDSAPPPPVGYFPVLPLAAAAALWTVRGRRG
jgi:hypothetical protein